MDDEVGHVQFSGVCFLIKNLHSPNGLTRIFCISTEFNELLMMLW